MNFDQHYCGLTTDWGLSPTRAYVTGISTFLLSQPSQYRPKTTSKTAITSVSSFLPKSAFFPSLPALKYHTLTNVVPNTLINSSLTAFYTQICEGCESKKCKIAGCARARTRESPIFNPHFVVNFSPRFLLHFPSHLRAKNHSFHLKILQIFPRKLFDYPKSSLSSTKNFALIKQKYSPIKQNIFSHKTQKTSEIIQKISNVFQKKSDVFSRFSHVIRAFSK